MTEPSEPRSRWQRWDALALAVVTLMVLAHARFAIVDERLPQDPNHCHSALPAAWQALDSVRGLAQLPELLTSQTTGWYNLALAATMHVVGRGPGAVQAWEVLWAGLLLAALGLIARHLWGPRGAFIAVAMISPCSYAMVLAGRLGWIHVPELALFLLVLLVLLADPGLVKKRTVIIAALAGMAGVSIRPSGMIWAATLAPFLLSGWLVTVRRRRFVVGSLAVLIPWALALIPAAHEMRSYMDNKIVSRTRYAFLADPEVLLQGLAADIGVCFAVVGLAGVAIRLVRFPRDRWRPMALLLVWLLLPFGLFAQMHAGMPNFPAYTAAFALLAAGGLARLPWPAALVPLLLWLPAYGAQWLPVGAARTLFDHRWTTIPAAVHTEDPINFYRPFRGITCDEVLTLLDETCAASGEDPCALHVDRCLFRPSGVDPGRLELFLTGRRVTLVPVWNPDHPAAGAGAAGMASYVCLQDDQDWRNRFPDMALWRGAVIADHDYELVWSRHVAPGCDYTWWVPAGVELDDAKLPSMAGRKETIPSPADWSVPPNE
jgi:hypothetical protein